MKPARQTNTAVFGLVGLILASVGCGGANHQARLRTAVDSHDDAFAQCYSASLRRDASREGVVRVALHVDGDSGRVDRVDMRESTIRDQGLTACLESALLAIQLQDPPDDDLYIEYTIELAQN